MSRENSISQSKIGHSFSTSFVLNRFYCCSYSFFGIQSIQEIRVSQYRRFIFTSCFRNIYVFKYIFYFNTKMIGKTPISLVTGRNSHYSSSSVTSQYIISNPNLYFISRERVNCKSTCVYTSNVFYISLSVTFCFQTSLVNVIFNSLFLICSCNFCYQFVLWCKHHKIHTKNSIRSCCKNFNLFI